MPSGVDVVRGELIGSPASDVALRSELVGNYRAFSQEMEVPPVEMEGDGPLRGVRHGARDSSVVSPATEGGSEVRDSAVMSSGGEGSER